MLTDRYNAEEAEDEEKRKLRRLYDVCQFVLRRRRRRRVSFSRSPAYDWMLAQTSIS